MGFYSCNPTKSAQSFSPGDLSFAKYCTTNGYSTWKWGPRWKPGDSYIGKISYRIHGNHRIFTYMDFKVVSFWVQFRKEKYMAPRKLLLLIVFASLCFFWLNAPPKKNPAKKSVRGEHGFWVPKKNRWKGRIAMKMESSTCEFGGAKKLWDKVGPKYLWWLELWGPYK